MPYLNYKNFRPSTEIPLHAEILHSHVIQHGMINCLTQYQWFSKESHNLLQSFAEYLSQNFFKLLLPDQPYTLLALDFLHHKTFILSQEITQLIPLPENQSQLFSDGTYQGLGQILLISLFIEEVDLKNGNILLSNTNKVIKIDGDYTFSSLQTKYGEELFSIHASTLSTLPKPLDFYCYHWLDFKIAEKAQSQSNIVGTQLHLSKHFQNELNQAILRICLLPQSFFLCFIQEHITEMGQFISKQMAMMYRQSFMAFFSCRYLKLKKAALEYEPFKLYIFSENAQLDVAFLSKQFNDSNLFTPLGMPTFLMSYQQCIPKLEENLYKFRVHFYPVIEISKQNIQLFLKNFKQFDHKPLEIFIEKQLKVIHSLEEFEQQSKNIIAIMDSLYYLDRIKKLKLHPLDIEVENFINEYFCFINQPSHEFSRIQSLKAFLFYHLQQTEYYYKKIYLPIYQKLIRHPWWWIKNTETRPQQFTQFISEISFTERATQLQTRNYMVGLERHLFHDTFFKPSLYDNCVRNDNMDIRDALNTDRMRGNASAQI